MDCVRTLHIVIRILLRVGTRGWMLGDRNGSNMYSGKLILTGGICVAIIAQLSLVMFYSVPNPDPAVTTSATTTPNNTAVNTTGTSDSSVAGGFPEKGKTQNQGFEKGAPKEDFPADNTDASADFDVIKRDPEDGNSDEAKTQTAIQSPEEIAELVQRNCVQIFDRDSGAQGTGVVVDVGKNGFEVLTACHVVKGANAISVFAFQLEAKEWVRREYRTVELVRCDEDSDLARIRIRTPIAHLSAIPMDILTKFAEKKLLGNEELAWTVSWTEDGKPVANESKIAERRTAQRKAGARLVSYWILNGPSEPGMSGGPLLSTRGELMGIASGNSGGNAFYVDEFEISRFSIGPPSSKND